VSRWIEHGAASDLSQTRLSRQVVDGVDTLLCWSGGEPYAYRNRCTHLNKPLDGGRLMAGQIQCPFHGACFDVRTGAALSGPALTSLQRIPVKVECGRLYLDVSESAAPGGAFLPALKG
jgi:nitrite reductase/ring-hydroxylating ferredoxin subunit